MRAQTMAAVAIIHSETCIRAYSALCFMVRRRTNSKRSDGMAIGFLFALPNFFLRTIANRAFRTLASPLPNLRFHLRSFRFPLHSLCSSYASPRSILRFRIASLIIIQDKATESAATTAFGAVKAKASLDVSAEDGVLPDSLLVGCVVCSALGARAVFV